MLRALILAGVCALAAGCKSVRPAWSIAAATQDTLRTTTLGEVLGGPGRYGSHAWLGIPFAAPPVGPLRWRPPQPAAPWNERLAATKFQRACVQPATRIVINEAEDGDVLGSEDCLTLNVWAPVLDGGKLPQGPDRLPVMVWIHGGGNSLGSAANYDLGHLAAGQRVLAISVQYRLGPLGWLRHPALRDGDPAGDSGNFGTLDLIQALQWVRDNAAAFGGDPGNVTLFGESAGGLNVYSLLASPLAKGLFHRAIAQSPTLLKGTLAQAENFADAAEPGHAASSSEALLLMLVRDGTAVDRAAARTHLAALDSTAVASYLRGKSARELVNVWLDVNAGRAQRMLDMPLVFADGVVLPKTRWPDLFANSDGWNRVPVLAGTNLDEAKLFLFIDPKFSWQLFGFLPRMRDEQKYQASSEAMSRLWKAWALDDVAEAMRASGATEVYAYRFDWAREPTKLGTDLAKMLGAAHGFEIPFVHGHFEGLVGELMGAEGDAQRDALSNAMMGYWGHFARTGSPGTGGGALPPWPAYDVAPGAPKFMTFDAAPPGLRMGSSVERADQVVADLLADPRIGDRAEKCAGLVALVKSGFLAAEKVAKDCPP